jgi:hypothetical protein
MLSTARCQVRDGLSDTAATSTNMVTGCMCRRRLCRRRCLIGSADLTKTECVGQRAHPLCLRTQPRGARMVPSVSVNTAQAHARVMVASLNGWWRAGDAVSRSESLVHALKKIKKG